MKKIKMLQRKTNYYYLATAFILTILVLFSFHSEAQITIDQSDMPSPGDTIRKSTALNTDLYDFSETGAGYTWDYSDLQPLIQTVDTFVNVTETPIVYWPFFILSSDMASPMADSPFPQIPLTDVFSFSNNTNSGFSDVGFAATVYGIPLPFKYDNGDVLYDFPMNYGNVDSSHSGFGFGVPGIGYILVDRYRVNTVDGWGNLTTPYGTFEVLRLKSVVHEYDSLYLDTLGIGMPINLDYIEYKWLAKGQKIPLLTATDNPFGMVVEYVDSIRDISSGTPEEIQLIDNGLQLFPNPAKDKLTLNFFLEKAGSIKISIVGIDGVLMATYNEYQAQTGNVNMLLNLKSLGITSGKYIVNVVTPNKSISGIFIFHQTN